MANRDTVTSCPPWVIARTERPSGLAIAWRMAGERGEPRSSVRPPLSNPPWPVAGISLTSVTGAHRRGWTGCPVVTDIEQTTGSPGDRSAPEHPAAAVEHGPPGISKVFAQTRRPAQPPMQTGRDILQH